MTNVPAIECDAVTVFRWSPKLKARVTLLHEISWRVERGEHWVVLGPNGAGKTTLLHLAGAMSHPSEGTVDVLGRRLGSVDMRALRERVGFVDARTSRAIKGKQTALQVTLTGAFSSIALQHQRLLPEHEERARAILAIIGAGKLIERSFEECSQGERQRILIARALMADPELLILDEPTVGLDLPSREELIGALATMAREHPSLTTVTVTHHLEEIPASATHALLLREGVLRRSGPISEVLTSELVSSCFGVPLEVDERRGRWSATLI
ncbi:MAG TPA: ATP-binding cassette domain-containing protein [Solirubrobacterales bacterium]|nr:ATP-binding cassette domain-containing protein [Solirubrobacterales bacterium]